MFRSALVFATLAFFFLPVGHVSAQSLTCGGSVLNSSDGTSADAASWTAYRAADPASKALGQVGSYKANFWAGEVGHVIGPLVPGDDLVVVLEKDVNATTAGHKGYYGVTGALLGLSDPASFPQTELRPIPVPSVSIAGSAVHLEWQAAQEEVAGNIVGYNIFRSADGISFERANAVPVTGLSYSDTEFSSTTTYYALGLAYRGASAVNGTVLSSNSNSGQSIDTDDDGLSDILELSSGMNNTSSDTDGDRISDGWEVQYGLDPLVDDSEADPDGDGISNYDEYVNGYDPTLAAPTATITATPNSGAAPLDVAFSFIANGDVSSVLWDFGDGVTSVEVDPIHTFVDSDLYTVKLTLVGSGGVSTFVIEVNCCGENSSVIIPMLELLLWK